MNRDGCVVTKMQKIVRIKIKYGIIFDCINNVYKGFRIPKNREDYRNIINFLVCINGEKYVQTRN